jgi:hypothetical protein
MVTAGDGDVLGVVTLLKASSMESSSTQSCYSRGTPRSGSPGSDDDGALVSLFLLGASFLEQLKVGGVKMWSGLHLSRMLCLSGVAQRSLGDSHALMDSRRVGAPSSAMVASMVRGFASVFHPGDGLVEGGGGDFWRMRTRRYLWIMPGSWRLRYSGHKAPCLASYVVLVWCCFWWLSFVLLV